MDLQDLEVDDIVFGEDAVMEELSRKK